MIDDRGRPSNLVKCCSRLITPNCLNDSHFSHDPLSSDDLVVKMSRTGAPRCYWHVTSHSCSRCYVAPGMTTRIFPLRLCTWQSRGASSDRLSGGGIRALEFIQETSEPLKSRLFFVFFFFINAASKRTNLVPFDHFAPLLIEARKKLNVRCLSNIILSDYLVEWGVLTFIYFF